MKGREDRGKVGRREGRQERWWGGEMVGRRDGGEEMVGRRDGGEEGRWGGGKVERIGER